MAITTVNTTDTFEQWRVKSNEIGTVVGDHTNSSSGDQLNTTATTVVGAINEHETQINSTVTATTTNTTNIAANTTAIATNATNIATNTTNIATNATNIATNTTNIATKATKGFSIAMSVALG